MPFTIEISEVNWLCLESRGDKKRQTIDDILSEILQENSNLQDDNEALMEEIQRLKVPLN